MFFTCKIILRKGDKVSNRKPKIEITLSEEEKYAIEKRATEENLKVTPFVRKIILDYIKEK